MQKKEKEKKEKREETYYSQRADIAVIICANIQRYNLIKSHFWQEIEKKERKTESKSAMRSVNISREEEVAH